MKIEITKDKIVEASKSASSLTGIWRVLGGKGSIPGSNAKKMRELVPDIAQRLAQKPEKTSKSKPVKKTDKKQGNSAMKSDYPRHSKNPFREGSGYAIAFDILASKPSGLPYETWKTLYGQAVKKDPKHSGYDLAVLLSAKDSSTGERHKSCREGFWIEREGHHMTLKTK